MPLQNLIHNFGFCWPIFHSLPMMQNLVSRYASLRSSLLKQPGHNQRHIVLHWVWYRWFHRWCSPTQMCKLHPRWTLSSTFRMDEYRRWSAERFFLLLQLLVLQIVILRHWRWLVSPFLLRFLRIRKAPIHNFLHLLILFTQLTFRWITFFSPPWSYSHSYFLNLQKFWEWALVSIKMVGPAVNTKYI